MRLATSRRLWTRARASAMRLLVFKEATGRVHSDLGRRVQCDMKKVEEENTEGGNNLMKARDSEAQLPSGNR